MIIAAIQFIPPNGTQINYNIEIKSSDLLEKQYERIKNSGCRFTVELLRNNHISLCLEDPDVGGYDIRILSDSAKISEATEEIIKNFKITHFKKWKKELLSDW